MNQSIANCVVSGRCYMWFHDCHGCHHLYGPALFFSSFNLAWKLHSMGVKEINITTFQHTTDFFVMLTNCNTFILSGIPMRRAFALTEHSATLMIIVHALNGWHTELAAISGARFVPPFQFWWYLSHTPCWLVAPPADNWWLCATTKSSQLYAITGSLHAKAHTHKPLQSINWIYEDFCRFFPIKQCRQTFYKSAYHFKNAVHLC